MNVLAYVNLNRDLNATNVGLQLIVSYGALE